MELLVEFNQRLRPQVACTVCGAELRYDQRQFDKWVAHHPRCLWSRVDRLLGFEPVVKEFYHGGAKAQKAEP